MVHEADAAALELDQPSIEPEEPHPSEGASFEAIRLQAEEHPLIGDAPPTSASEHCLRLMHLKAYDEAAALASARDVLDVGCNTGYGTLRFLDRARRVTGVDVSARAIDAARLATSDDRAEFLAIDGLSLPFPDASFDLVVSFQVLEHILDPLPFLNEIRRVVRPGGIVVLTTPNAATRLDPGMTPWNRFHVREYRAPQLAELLGSIFPRVQVRGMFGTPTLYETEIQRVAAVRQRVRRAEAAAERAARKAASATALEVRRARRPLPVRVARAIVPSRTRSWLRSIRSNGRGRPTAPVRPRLEAIPAEGAVMDLEAFRRFSVADLFYADEDLDRAMDLMAVCRVD